MTPNAALRHSAILVVEDDLLLADSIVEILNREGYAAYAVYDGDDAIEAALLYPPKLVILDVILPGMNGIDVGIEIRRVLPDCRVIIFSSHSASNELVAAALSAGSHFAFLQKPLHPRVLLKHVAESLNPLSQTRQRGGTAGGMGLEATLPEDPVSDCR